MPEEFYVWEVEGRPTRVLLALPVVERLNALVLEAFRAYPDNPRDTFGILLGRSRKEGRSCTIAVDDFLLVDALPDRLPGDSEQRAVGLFRGRKGTSLRLDPSDASAIERLFHRPDLVYLVIQPLAGAPARAAFFIPEDGRIHGYRPLQEFPFHAQLLRTGGFPLSEGSLVRERKGAFGMAAITLGVRACTATMWALRHNPSAPATGAGNSMQTPVATVARPQPPAAVSLPPPDPASPAFIDKPSPVRSRTPALSSREALASDGLEARRAGTYALPNLPDLPEPPSVIPAVPPDQLKPVMHRAGVTSVALEPVPPNRVRRIIARVPGLRLLQRRNYHAGDLFVPPRPVRHAVPAVPEKILSRLTADVPIDLKLHIDPEGRVSDLEIINASRQPELTRLAADAAERWRFEPAQLNHRAVSSEVMARFRFRPPEFSRENP